MVRRCLLPVLIASGCMAPTAGAHAMFANGFEPQCDTADVDDDRLSGCQEILYKTNPHKRDTDDDGIGDGDEVLGTIDGLNLPALGTNPLRKDILVEHDWTDDAFECALHSHRPTPANLEQLRQLFANAPVVNPDGSLGINLVNDAGQGGALTGGNVIAVPNGMLGAIGDEDYLLAKSANFDSNRLGYFRYMVHAHVYTNSYGSTGSGETPGDESLVTMGCYYHDQLFARNTILHELGHNLGLRHGGASDCNYKPNYNSVMNYMFARFGVDADCDSDPDGITDLSSGTNVDIDETNVDEGTGVCGSPAINWNYIEPSDEANLVLDLNQLEYYAHPPGWQEMECGGTYTVLTDDDDWGGLNLLALPNPYNSGGGIPVGKISVCLTPMKQVTP